MKILSTVLLFTSLSAIAAPPSYPWESKVGATLTEAMKKNVVTVRPGSCVEIVNAINSLPAAGGTVRLEAGRFDCSVPVAIERDNVRLVGAGSDKTILRLNDYTAKPLIVVGVLKAKPEKVDLWGNISEEWYPLHQVHNVIVENIGLDGNREKQTNGFECYDQDEELGKTCETGAAKFVRNNGVTIRGAESVTVRNIIANKTLSGGLVTEKRCKHLLIDGFYSEDNVFDGFAGYETIESVVRNMTLVNQKYSGVSLDLGFVGNVLENITSNGNGDNGIFAVNVGYTIFRNITALNNKNKGFYFEGKHRDGKLVRGTCDGHTIYNVKVAGNGSNPVHVQDACEGITIDRANLQTTGSNVCIFKNAGADVKVSNSKVCEN